MQIADRCRHICAEVFNLGKVWRTFDELEVAILQQVFGMRTVGTSQPSRQDSQPAVLRQEERLMLPMTAPVRRDPKVTIGKRHARHAHLAGRGASSVPG